MQLQTHTTTTAMLNWGLMQDSSRQRRQLLLGRDHWCHNSLLCWRTSPKLSRYCYKGARVQKAHRRRDRVQHIPTTVHHAAILQPHQPLKPQLPQGSSVRRHCSTPSSICIRRSAPTQSLSQSADGSRQQPPYRLGTPPHRSASYTKRPASTGAPNRQTL